MNSSFLVFKSIRIRFDLINYQTVRWRKKPFWLGRAKTKMFIVRQPLEVPPDEKLEYNLLRTRYLSALNSLMSFIKVDNPKLKDLHISTEAEETGHMHLSPALEKKVAESFEKNEQWNAESARLREERKNITREKLVEKSIQVIETRTENLKKRQEVIEEIVRKEKVLSESFITPENLDEAIENCLNKVECHDFAIDLDGNRYFGREPFQAQLNANENKVEQNVGS